MRIILNIDKSIEQNAGIYFDRAKKAKLKAIGATDALKKSQKILKRTKKKQDAIKETIKIKREKKWYEKFRWFFSSEEFLVIGGRDATSNDIIIKKYAEKEDIVFHTDMAGSPFFVIKSGGKKITEKTLKETACATAIYSRAWKKGLATTEVFYVTPEQVTKKANSGESLSKGAFMIYGKTTYLENNMKLAIGILDGVTIGGPLDAIKSQTKYYVRITQGDKKTSNVAKMIKKKIGGELDDIIRFLPAGGVNFK